MQNLLVELKNTSGNAPQVLCSVSEALNIEGKLSVCLAQEGTRHTSPCRKHVWKTINTLAHCLT